MTARRIIWPLVIALLLVAAAYLGLRAVGMPVLLWTDALIFLIVAVIAAYFVRVRQLPHLGAPWRRLASSRAGMTSVVVLAAFVLTGLLDSLHFRPALERNDAQGARVYANDVRSVLDLALAPLLERGERTYSAPFATRAFSKELLETRDGVQVRDYPRLRWGGAHLQDESKRGQDILATSARAIAWALLAWSLLALALAWGLARAWNTATDEAWNRIVRARTEVPWRAILITLGVMLLIVFPAAALSLHYHVLGTDKVGQDVLYRALKSIRTALVIGTLTTLVMAPVAVILGIMAGYFKGWIDDVIQYVYTTLNSIPGVLLIAAAVLMMQVYIDTHPELFPTAAQRADLRLLFLCIILGLTSWTGLARLLRGEALKLSQLEYVQAAEAFGVRDAGIIARHILPNVMHIVIITLVMDFSGLVLAEAVLSYVGVGVDPSMISFGTMINSARLEMSRDPVVWWSLSAAFVFMFVLVLAANLFADAVRDAFDPRVRMGGLITV